MQGAINGDSTQHRYQGTEGRAKGILLSRGFEGLDLLADPPISEPFAMRTHPILVSVRHRTQSPGPNHRASDNGSPSQNQARPQTRSMWSTMAARGVRLTLPQHTPPLPRHSYLRMWETTYPPTL